MNLGSDFDFDITRKIKQGRRANQTFSPSTSLDLDTLENISESNTKIPGRPKKTGGWADDTLKSGKSKNATNLIEQQRFHEQKIDLDDDIPVIPDIEEIHDDILETDIAHAPSIPVKSVSTYKELDSEFLNQNNLRQFGDINLSFLTRFMYTDKEMKESDETWTKESLFNELIANRSDYTEK